ncbi:MAG: CapA family protein [Saccharofermentanales bacterium]
MKKNKGAAASTQSRTAPDKAKAAGRKKRRGIARLFTCIVIAAVAFVLVFSSTGSLVSFMNNILGNRPGTSPEITEAPSTSPSLSPSPSPEPDLSAQAVIMATGDIILHKSVIDGGLQSSGIYDFNHLFAYVKDYFAASDLTVANFEGTMNGPEYSGYPLFNAPDEIASAIRSAGIGMVTTANNHAYDSGIAGLKRTPAIFREAGVSVIGTRSDPEDPVFEIADLNGIKVAFTGYTYETTGTGTRRALNGNLISKEAEPLIDSFNYYRTDRFELDKQGMAARITEMREAGAECIVFVIHWGDEYKTVSGNKQQDMAKFLADSGADIIIGHHPHVIQEIGVIESRTSGRRTLVYYSIGNFLANMGFNTHSTSGYAEDAIIARIGISRDKYGKVTVDSGEYIKTYIFKDESSGRRIHRVVPVADAIEHPGVYKMDPASVGLVEASSIRISAVLDASADNSGKIRVGEYK